MGESNLSAPLPTPPEAEATAPDLPAITLSPTPLSRSPLAAVYRGWDRVHHCDVFVKVQRATGDTVAMDRFRREAAVMGRLRHPNIVALYRFYDGDPAALVMEYVPGQTLAALVGADGWLSLARAASIIEGIAAALDLAHARGIIHRDVKPANILLPRRGAARLTDFGVAHIEGDAPLTVMGDILGTIEYASPEQVHGNETPDTRSDVYSLAAVAYFALTGTPPFRAADNSTQAQLSVMHRQVFADPPPLRFHREDLSDEVEQAVLRGLAKAPDARYQSAGQLAAALRAAVEAESGPPEQRAMARASRRTGALAGALAGAILLLLAGIAVWKEEPVPSPRLHPQEAARHLPPHSPPVSVVPKPPLPAPSNPVPPVQAAIASRPAKPKLPAKPLRKPLLAAVPKPAPRPKRKPTLVAVKPIATPKTKVPKKIALKKSGPKKMRLAQHPAMVAAPGQAWLYVYANQNIAPLGRTPRMASIRAEGVYVDGQPYPALAAGRWAAVPSGKHTLSFFPYAQSGFSPHAGIPITLIPGARVARQILLPVMTNFSPRPKSGPHIATAVVPRVASPKIGWFSVSGWIATNAPGQKPELTRAPAAWIKVDGQPVAALAQGQWAQLPAGRHIVTFQPAPDLGVASKTWAIDLAPQAHLQQQVPLPALPLPVIPTHLRNP